MADFEYTAEIDDSQIKEAFEDLEKSATSFEQRGDRAIKNIGASSGKAASRIESLRKRASKLRGDLESHGKSIASDSGFLGGIIKLAPAAAAAKVHPQAPRTPAPIPRVPPQRARPPLAAPSSAAAWATPATRRERRTRGWSSLRTTLSWWMAPPCS